MKDTFQIILLIVFMAAGIFGVLVFSGAIPLGGGDGNAPTGNVVLWGTTSATLVSPLIDEFNNDEHGFTISYVQKSSDSFDKDLLEALASGVGPDIFFLPDYLVFSYANKIFPISYTSYSLVDFKNTFAGAGEVFLTSNGILALPMSIDPLILYYNRSTLDSNGIIYPPKTWEELANQVPLLTQKDNTNKIIKPAVSFGHFSNVTYAKDILVAMFMQTGNPIVSDRNGALRSYLDNPNTTEQLASILEFYINFADPEHPTYSWNKSFPNSTSAFSSEDLAYYFGFASELQSLVNRNPNQNFGVAPIPQMSNAAPKITNARVTGVAISSATKNFTAAFTAASLLATGDFASKFAVSMSIPPARRDLLAVKPADAYSPFFYDSALYGKSWLDPSFSDTNNIFRTMIDATISNNTTALEAINNASSRMNLLLIK